MFGLGARQFGKPQPVARKSKAKKDPRAEYDAMMSELLEQPVRNYSPRESFGLRDKVNHPTLGMGIVVRLRGNGKLELLFAEGLKTLIHGKDSVAP